MRRHLRIGRFVLRGLVRRGGTWAGRIRDTETGEVHQRGTRHRSRQAAHDELVAYLQDLDTSGGASRSERRLAQAWADWLEIHGEDLRPQSIATYRWVYRRAIDEPLGARRLAGLRPIDIERWVLGLRREGRVSDTTIAHWLQILRIFFRWAVRQEWMPADPSRAIRIRVPESQRGQAFTVDETRALFRFCAQGRRTIYVAAAIALYTGFRRENVRRLRWSQVDFDRRRIVIPAAQWKGRREQIRPIHPALDALLREQARRTTTFDHVLGRLYSTRLTTMLHRACEDSGVPSLRFHDLRHTYASWLAERVPYAVLQALLGHAPHTVTDRYTHPSWQRLVEGIETLPDVLPPGLGKKSENGLDSGCGA